MRPIVADVAYCSNNPWEFTNRGAASRKKRTGFAFGASLGALTLQAKKFAQARRINGSVAFEFWPPLVEESVHALAEILAHASSKGLCRLLVVWDHEWILENGKPIGSTPKHWYPIAIAHYDDEESNSRRRG